METLEYYFDDFICLFNYNIHSQLTRVLKSLWSEVLKPGDPKSAIQGKRKNLDAEVVIV
jgi:hypothetical protein